MISWRLPAYSAWTLCALEAVRLLGIGTGEGEARRALYRNVIFLYPLLSRPLIQSSGCPGDGGSQPPLSNAHLRLVTVCLRSAHHITILPDPPEVSA